MFETLAATVQPHQRVAFWAWFLSLGTDMLMLTPTVDEVVNGGGPGLWPSIVERAIVLEREDEAKQLLPAAIDGVLAAASPRRIHHLKDLARYARRLDQVQLAADLLDQAEQFARSIANPAERIEALLGVIVAKRDAALA